MSTVDEIVAAVRRLSPADYLRLRRKLDRLEQRVWDAELERTTTELKRARITEKAIDRRVLRRRREVRR
jgi:hypothetical protein